MLKKNKSSKLDVLSLASKLQRKRKQSVKHRVLIATIGAAGVAAVTAVGRAAKGRDAR